MGKFIDVSEFNTIDWAKAKSAVDYAYIRCGLRGSLKKTAPKDYGKIRYDKKWAKINALTFAWLHWEFEFFFGLK